jgi:Double-stranded RNA binding motif
MAELPEQDIDEPLHNRPPDPVNAALPNQNENQQIVSDDGTEFPRLAMHYSPPHFLLPHQQQAIAMAQYYEARMRDHAAAYASAAAGAAWAAAQIAASSRLPPTLPIVEQPQFFPPYLHQAYPTEFAFGSSQSHHNSHSSASIQENRTHDERPVKRHHKMPNSIDVDSQERRGRRRQRVDGSSSSDGGRFQFKSKRQNPHPNHRSNQYHYQSQSKRRDKINLLQKTAVSALHEWCVHEKKQPPKFVLTAGSSDGFCFAVYVDDLEWSRGRGATKASAKQDAAQKALQALVPGVVFDDSGLVVAIKLSHPKSDCKNKADTAHDAFDALPNLAERLAIDATKKRRCNIYPETTTTTDDDGDDENAYYANRGASVCSALLHALWQIDDRIPEPPSYSYDIPPSGKSKEGARPSSFSCTATLKLQATANNSEFSNHSCYQGKEGDDNPETDRREKAQSLSISDKDRSSIFNCHDKDNISIQILSAVGLGTTKRDARHVASAKLLALLFPECEGMVEVKAAAEAAREKYAKSKALKQQSKRNVTGCNMVPKANILSWPCSPSQRSHWLAQSSDPHLPTSTVEWMKSLLNYSSSSNNDLSHVEEVSVESLTLSEPKESIPSITHHPRDTTKQEKLKTSEMLLRQIQWENIVDHALQSLNELDDDGRSLPIDPDYEDIGRLVLRRGDSNDSALFNKHRFAQESRHDNSPLPTSPASCQSELEGPPFSITVFMCRAIALHDEAPLGYAMLTLGFSLEKGRILRITNIGSEPHLPRERFVERLQLLAVQMKCHLDTGTFHHKKSAKMHRRIVTTPQLRDIVESFHCPNFFFSDESGSKLQSVKEEENEIEDDINDKESLLLSLKDKPSKRSRID